jgi:integrase
MGKKWRRYSVGKYSLQQLNGRAVVVWRDEEGRRQRRILGADSEQEGKAQLDAFARRVRLLTAETEATVGAIYRAYTADREKDGKLMRTFHESWRALGKRFETLPVEAITADVCRDYARDRLETVAQGTVWTELTRLRACLSWAAKARLIPSPPPLVWLPQKPKPKDRVLSEDEVSRLIEAADAPHVRLFIVLAITTGGRKSALLELTWDRVDFGRGTIDLRSRDVYSPLTKGWRKGRAVVPMTDEAREELLAARDGALSDRVIEWNGAPVANIRKGFMAAASRAGIGPEVTPHTLRHSVATWLEEDGVDIAHVSRMIGHRDPSTTRRIYQHPRAETLRSVADAVSARLKRVR